mmetsp:Transcript_61603/g.101774  ORF Transcript_61603/g.101774 Transcript_61603/m.101774 type:complete len:272 (+) Transcript_61603:1364-2179(+)
MKLLVDNCRPNCTGTQCPETDSHQQCKTVLVQVNYLLKDNASVPDDEDAAERQCRILHDGRAVEHSKEKAEGRDNTQGPPDVFVGVFGSDGRHLVHRGLIHHVLLGVRQVRPPQRRIERAVQRVEGEGLGGQGAAGRPGERLDVQGQRRRRHRHATGDLTLGAAARGLRQHFLRLLPLLRLLWCRAGLQLLWEPALACQGILMVQCTAASFAEDVHDHQPQHPRNNKRIAHVVVDDWQGLRGNSRTRSSSGRLRTIICIDDELAAPGSAAA